MSIIRCRANVLILPLFYLKCNETLFCKICKIIVILPVKTVCNSLSSTYFYYIVITITLSVTSSSTLIFVTFARKYISGTDYTENRL